MKEIKLTIDGKEVKLTDEQLRLLEIRGKWSNPFSRVKKTRSFIRLVETVKFFRFLKMGTMPTMNWKSAPIISTTKMLPHKLPFISCSIGSC